MGDAENVAADALARALVRWRKVRDLPYRDAWVLRVTINLAIDDVRRRRPHTTTPPVGEDFADDTVRQIDLVAATAQLPKRQREAVALRHLVGLSEAETAAAMGVAPSTVKEHTQRGMAHLRAHFGAHLQEVPDAI